MFDPKGLRPFLANWEDVAKGLFERVYRESVGRVIDEKTRELLSALAAYPDVKMEWKTPRSSARRATPVIPLSFIRDGQALNYFSMVTTVGAPRTIAAQELRIECMFPVDEATEARHALLMRDAPALDSSIDH